jgi:hypothetical protein
MGRPSSKEASWRRGCGEGGGQACAGVRRQQPQGPLGAGCRQAAASRWLAGFGLGREGGIRAAAEGAGACAACSWLLQLAASPRATRPAGAPPCPPTCCLGRSACSTTRPSAPPDARCCPSADQHTSRTGTPLRQRAGRVFSASPAPQQRPGCRCSQQRRHAARTCALRVCSARCASGSSRRPRCPPPCPLRHGGAQLSSFTACTTAHSRQPASALPQAARARASLLARSAPASSVPLRLNATHEALPSLRYSSMTWGRPTTSAGSATGRWWWWHRCGVIERARHQGPFRHPAIAGSSGIVIGTAAVEFARARAHSAASGSSWRGLGLARPSDCDNGARVAAVGEQ